MEQLALPPSPTKRRIHPLAKWSLGAAAATVPICLLADEFLLIPLIGGGLAIVLGICGCLAEQEPSRQFRGYRVSVAGVIVGLVTIGLAIGYSNVAKVRPNAARSQSTNNLKRMALAMHDYQDTYGRLPPAASKDANGQPLLSWHVAILPFIEEEKLYGEFHLDEPWDSPHNSQLLDKMPLVYRSPGRQLPAPNTTFYRVFVGPGAAFERDGLKIPVDFPDGAANTILIAEAGDAVHWTKPDELVYSANKPLPPLGGVFLRRDWLGRRKESQGCLVALADASVRWLPRATPEATVRAYITRNGGEKIGE
jgi:hypothetical protein